MRSRRPLLALLLLIVALGSLPVHAQNKPPVTPGDPRAVYIVVLNREKGAEPEFDKGGPKLLGRWSNRVVVELPPAALEAMRKHGRVKYVQHLITGPVTAAGATSAERPASASLVARTMTGGGTLQWSTGDYHYDGSGNIDRIGADGDGQTRRFVYDEIDRLVQAGLEAPMAAPGTYTNYSNYTYDSFGNRLSEQTPSINETVTADRNTNRVTLPGTIVTYDGVGNMTQGGGLMYQYDPFNNLKEVDNWSGVQKMAIYNADNERIIFCGDGSVGPCRWTLRGHGNEVLREYESGPIGNGNYWSYYLWVEDSVYRGRLLAGAQREAAEGGRLHFHLDQIGSPRLTTNATGQKVTANEFAPFGRELTSITQEAQLGYDRTETHRFTGHERDFVEGTGSDTVNFIDYMHARSYTTVFGRFLSADPMLRIKQALRQPQAWNRYSYVLNNPLLLIDPTGWYDVNCTSGSARDQKRCNAAAARFETQRQLDLQSNQQSVRNAAAAWGTPNDHNGVTVAFLSQSQVNHDAGRTQGNTDGFVDPHGSQNGVANIQVEFVYSMSNNKMAQAIAHEGSHIDDDFRFIKSFDPATGRYRAALNSTHFDTEFKAYETGSLVSPYPDFRVGPSGYQALETFIRNNYPSPESLVFEPAQFPQQ